MKLSEKLDILLTRKNIKRVDFSEKLGITYRAFAYYMSDTRTPRKAVLEKMARELGVSTDFLINDDVEIELTQEEKFIKSIADNGQNPSEAAKFLSQSKGLFAGNTLTEKDKDNLMRCLTEIYKDSRKDKEK